MSSKSIISALQALHRAQGFNAPDGGWTNVESAKKPLILLVPGATGRRGKRHTGNEEIVIKVLCIVRPIAGGLNDTIPLDDYDRFCAMYDQFIEEGQPIGTDNSNITGYEIEALDRVINVAGQDWDGFEGRIYVWIA